MEISQQAKELVRFYDDNYELVFQHIQKIGQKKHLGDLGNRRCRFCGKSAVETTFVMDAHAYPECIGNKTLYLRYECDTCNQHFSKTIEDSLAKYTMLERTLAQVNGKNGVPSAKSRDNKSRIDVKRSGVEIISHKDSNFIDIDIDQKRIEFSNEIQPYVPRLVYKCFVKMALSVLPEDDLVHFSKALKWINFPDYTADPIQTSKMCTVMCSFTPGPSPNGPLVSLLLRRINDNMYIPHYIFFVAFSNFSYQIAIPFSDKDSHLDEKKVTIPAFPTIKHGTNEYGDVQYGIINLSSNEIVRGKKSHITMRFEDIRSRTNNT